MFCRLLAEEPGIRRLERHPLEALACEEHLQEHGKFLFPARSDPKTQSLPGFGGLIIVLGNVIEI